jgi:hypothetical protein
MTKDDMWDKLIDELGISEDTLWCTLAVVVN